MKKKILQLNILINEGKFEEVELLCKDILKAQPTNPSINHTLAIAQQKVGKINEAEISYKKAIELKPDYFECYYNLGFLLRIINKLNEAEESFEKAIEIKPDFFQAYGGLAGVEQRLGKLNEAKKSYKKAIELKPDYAEAFMNLGVTYHKLHKLNKAEINYKKAIELKPDYIEAHSNLGGVLKDLNRFDEAEISYRKAIELKPDYIIAHNSLGSVLKELDKFDEAEISYRKAIKLKPDYEEALLNLNILVKDKKLLGLIFEAKKSKKKNKVSYVDSSVGLNSNPFITHRNVETKLIKELYKSELIELNKTKDARYGNGKCSDFNFLKKNDSPNIKVAREDLIKIMKRAVKSDIFIFTSFLNIYGAGSGSNPHNHISRFDKNQGLINQKYSLTYYLSVGDQNCSEPGNLQLYDPFEEIKLSEGTIVIIPATRKHGAVYSGKTDRIMIGINFYSLI